MICTGELGRMIWPTNLSCPCVRSSTSLFHTFTQDVGQKDWTKRTVIRFGWWYSRSFCSWLCRELEGWRWESESNVSACHYFLIYSCCHINIHYSMSLHFRSNIGLPFYGRSFAGEGLTKFGRANDGAADILTWEDDGGTPQCK